MDSVQGSIRGNSYHIMSIKEPDYVMLMMTTYGTLEHLEGSDTQQRYKGGGGSWWPNNSTIVRYYGITSITDINLTTTTIVVIIFFQLIGIGIKGLARPVPCLLLGIDRGQCKLPTGVPLRRSWCGASVGFSERVGMRDVLENTLLIDIWWRELIEYIW